MCYENTGLSDFGRVANDFPIFTRQSYFKIWFYKIVRSEIFKFLGFGPVRSVLVSGSLIKINKFLMAYKTDFWLHNWRLRKRSQVTPDDLPLMIWSCDSRVLIVNDQHEYLRSAKPAHTRAWLKKKNHSQQIQLVPPPHYPTTRLLQGLWSIK